MVVNVQVRAQVEIKPGDLLLDENVVKIMDPSVLFVWIMLKKKSPVNLSVEICISDLRGLLNTRLTQSEQNYKNQISIF